MSLIMRFIHMKNETLKRVIYILAIANLCNITVVPLFLPFPVFIISYALVAIPLASSIIILSERYDAEYIKTNKEED